MAQLERTRRSNESMKSPKAQTSPTFEHLLRAPVDEVYWSPTTSPKSGTTHGHEECLSPSNNNRKSVLAKVKERAKKLKHTLSGRKNVNANDDNTTPTSVEDEEDEDEDIDDPEYLGAPMYESEAAPEILKENARQHPRAVPVVSENRRTPNRKNLSETVSDNETSPRMSTMTEAVSEKIAPAYAAMSDATHKIASKIAGLTIAPSEALTGDETGSLTQYAANSGGPRTWDKGISVKEYFMNKMEPGEDERALSQAITEAISPRSIPNPNNNNNNNTGVVEKVKEAVTSFFWNENSPDTTAKTTRSLSDHSSSFPNSIQTIDSHSSRPDSSPLIPLSSNAHQVFEEENNGKILQAN